MTFRLLPRRRAKAEVRSAARWYERQRTGLGREFIAEVDHALTRVAENLFQYEVLHREARRGIVRRFPYGVFYRIEKDKNKDKNEVVVFCVIHLHRDPGSWKKRVSE